jgi:restriction endonuclease S subunit
MSAIIRLSPRAFVVWWKDAPRWDVAYFQQLKWEWPDEIIRPVGDAIIRRRAELNGKADPTTLPIIEKISFGGEISVTEPDDRKGYKGRLFWADPGNLIYSKIRAKQGSLAIVGPDIGRLAVSAEYPVYEIDENKADSAFLAIVFRSKPFLRLLEGLSHGGSTKTRIPPEEFERQRIPLPPLPVQRKIVAAHEAARQYAAQAAAKIERLERDIKARFLADLGLSAPEQASLPKAFAVWWSEFLRWSVSYNQQAQTGADITRGKYPVASLGSCLSMVQYGTSEKANSVARGTRILRINNVKGRTVDITDLKHLELSEKAQASLLLADGDILVIRTSGSRDLVGTCAVFHQEGDYVFASYLIRLRPDPSIANPDFIVWFLNSPLGRQQVDATSRQIMQNNINSEELRSLQIPLPPLSVQQPMMKRVEAGQAHIARLKADAQARAEAARADVEAMILGMKPI